jgi:hypothetical protein
VVLDAGALVALRGALGTLIAVIRGAAWVTQAQGSRDIVLHAGQAFELDRAGRGLMETSRGASVNIGARTAAIR